MHGRAVSLYPEAECRTCPQNVAYILPSEPLGKDLANANITLLGGHNIQWKYMGLEPFL